MWKNPIIEWHQHDIMSIMTSHLFISGWYQGVRQSIFGTFLIVNRGGSRILVKKSLCGGGTYWPQDYKHTTTGRLRKARKVTSGERQFCGSHWMWSLRSLNHYHYLYMWDEMLKPIHHLCIEPCPTYLSRIGRRPGVSHMGVWIKEHTHNAVLWKILIAWILWNKKLFSISWYTGLTTLWFCHWRIIETCLAIKCIVIIVSMGCKNKKCSSQVLVEWASTPQGTCVGAKASHYLSSSSANMSMGTLNVSAPVAVGAITVSI